MTSSSAQPYRNATDGMPGIAQVGVLAADLGAQRGELRVDERADERDDAARRPHAEDRAGVWTCRATTYGLMKMPEPMIS